MRTNSNTFFIILVLIAFIFFAEAAKLRTEKSTSVTGKYSNAGPLPKPAGFKHSICEQHSQCLSGQCEYNRLPHDKTCIWVNQRTLKGK